MTHPGWAPLTPYAPPPPQPGVIPLAPLSLGDYFGALPRLLRHHWRPLLGLGAAAVGLVHLVLYLVSAAAVLQLGSDDPFLALDQGLTDSLLAAVAVAVLAGGLLSLLSYAFVSALCPAVLHQAVLGRTTPAPAVGRRALRRVPALIGALALLTAACLLPFLLVATLALFSGPFTLLMVLPFLPVVVWCWVRCSLAPAVAVIEGAGPLTALRRSARLVRGAWWRVFGIQLLMGLVGTVAAAALTWPFDELSAALPVFGDGLEFAFGGVLLLPAVAAALLTTLLSQTTAALLYTDQRIRREGLARTLAQAAYTPR
ncbi:hypothetical protein ACIBI4_15980 [Streptomyces sp. NPDC050418]|uniref:hypothetical protein n=1 Tax=Streptomyces sp. NPDC050418 TaxID=3365612 RepID=UPI0037BB521C